MTTSDAAENAVSLLDAINRVLNREGATLDLRDQPVVVASLVVSATLFQVLDWIDDRMRDIHKAMP